MLSTTWCGGYWNDGLFANGNWNDGDFYGGTFLGTWNGGIFHYGIKNGILYTQQPQSKWNISNIQTSITSPPPAF
jgi:hypothetical protein